MTELPEDYVRVLDKGYVGLLGVYGDDRGKVSPPNAARTSFKKNSASFTDEQNDRLTHYLLRNKEYACLRHNVMTFELRVPLMVARQLFKYVVGSNFTEDQLGWNENSKRYITEENEFYIPLSTEWRSAPENAKQGSGTPLPEDKGLSWTQALIDWTSEGERLYGLALQDNLAPELARLFTANGNYVTVQWTTSLNALLHFLDERLDSHAQHEIRLYAQAVEQFFRAAFPVVYSSWDSVRIKERLESKKLGDFSELATKYHDLLKIVRVMELDLEAVSDRDDLYTENQQLKQDLENTKSKSWFARLKGK